MTLPISPTTTAASATAAASSPTAPAVNEQQFMQLLIAQLQHQDPTQPVQGTEFVTQLAQFSLVEQSANQTTQLTNVSTQIAGLGNNEAAQLVGKTVTLNGNSTTYDGTVATPANATLSAPAAQVTATIMDSSGNVVQTMQLGPHAAGPVSVNWNGTNSAGLSEPSGTYTVNVTATASGGGSVGVTQSVSGVVSSISFAQGSPQVVLASGATAPLSTIASVGASSATP
jgi:flagellar basal-body rod modification protein FlgD